MESTSHVLSADTQATVLLCGNLHTKKADDVLPLTLTEYNQLAQWLLAQKLRPGDLLGEEGNARLRQVGNSLPDVERILRLLDRGALLALQVESWTNHGLWVLSRSDELYPKRLKDHLKQRTPPILYGAGTQNILNRGGLAIVGSRDADERALEFTRMLASRCAQDDLSVISGGAKGIDQTAMLTALQAEGIVLGVLADSLAKASVSGQYRHALRDERLVLVSPHAPHTGFSVGNAMGRNKLIYALSDWTIVVSSDAESGGTWSGATENLKHKWVPIFVRVEQDVPSGNLALLQKGALRLEPQMLQMSVGSLKEHLDQAQGTQGVQLPPERPEILLEQGQALEEASATSIAMVKSVNLSGTIDADFFWNGVVWPLISRLVAERGSINKQSLSKTLGIKSVQADEWLKQAVSEGKLKKQGRPVSYVAPEGGQMPLLGQE